LEIPVATILLLEDRLGIVSNRCQPSIGHNIPMIQSNIEAAGREIGEDVMKPKNDHQQGQGCK